MPHDVYQDWFRNGWDAVMPPGAYSVFMSCSYVTDAEAEIDGDLTEYFDLSTCFPRSPQYPHGWETLVDWGENVRPRSPFEDPASVERERRRMRDRRELFEQAMAGAGLPCPQTLRELVRLMTDWGLIEPYPLAPGVLWRLPPALPYPDQVLPLPESLTSWMEEQRWVALMNPVIDRLLDYVGHFLDFPDEMPVSLDLLAACIDEDVPSVRQAMVVWQGQGQISAERHCPCGASGPQGRCPVNLERVPSNRRFLLLPDWMSILRDRAGLPLDDSV
ncbi:DUF6042 family protein [Allostreptomyces psammosilenae]|uniref:Uncharacterized protein n=1 Tax=Allostreptomyces psammosilenae TaxID=1892865 RepID=A0A853ABF1_9ACTN|nr:DUF6042 family protein [Allostreptomyces psammosilenae]NYI07818.1 hypothetical protein [Allostreptomyces psammosilenae]